MANCISYTHTQSFRERGRLSKVSSVDDDYKKALLEYNLHHERDACCASDVEIFAPGGGKVL